MWYPGHIEKAKRNIRKVIKYVDAVVEVLDARIPVTSRAYEYSDVFSSKQEIFLLNKTDIADPAVTRAWKDHFTSIGEKVFYISLKEQSVKTLLSKEISPSIRSRLKEKRILIAGMPNVGKSTFVNRLRGKKAARVRSEPGTTRGPQWVQISDTLFVMDTPGILYRNLFSESIKTKLMAAGSIVPPPEKILDASRNVYDLVVSRYGKKTLEDALRISFDDSLDMLRKVSRSRGLLISGGEEDMNKAASFFLKELAMGRLGRFSYELPGEADEEDKQGTNQNGQEENKSKN